jgi:hypothetical protein
MRNRQHPYKRGAIGALAGGGPNPPQTEFGFARLGVRDEGRVSSACSVGKRGVNWRNPAYAKRGKGCNAASIMRDSRRDGTPFQCAAIHAPRSVIASAAPAVPFLPDGRRHNSPRPCISRRVTRLAAFGRRGTFIQRVLKGFAWRAFRGPSGTFTVGPRPISLRRQLAGHAAQDLSQPLGLSAPLGVGICHAQQSGVNDEQGVAKNLQGVACDYS